MSRNSDAVLQKTGKCRARLRVIMTLDDVLYLSYAVPVDKVRKLVPEALELATAGGMTFVSIVVLRSTGVRLSLMPFIRFSYYQLNIRTYVADPLTGRTAVYFIHSGITSRFISQVTRVLGIPWQFIDIKAGKNLAENSDSYVATGNWSESFTIKARESPESAVIPAFFDSRIDAVDFLVRPLIGFIGRGSWPGRFTIQHESIEPESWLLTDLSFPLFTDLGVVDQTTEPHSVFFLSSAEFTINLPPKQLR